MPLKTTLTFFLTLIAGALVHAQVSSSRFTADAYKILEGPLDEGKLDTLKPYGLDRVAKVRNKDGALVAENYASFDGRVSAVVKRNADTGKVLSIAIDESTARGKTHSFWNLIAQTFSACAPGMKNGCHVTKIKECKDENAGADNRLRAICPFLAEVVLPPKVIAEASPTASAAPSPKPSQHRSRLIFKH